MEHFVHSNDLDDIFASILRLEKKTEATRTLTSKHSEEITEIFNLLDAQGKEIVNITKFGDFLDQNKTDAKQVNNLMKDQLQNFKQSNAFLKDEKEKEDIPTKTKPLVEEKKPISIETKDKDHQDKNTKNNFDPKILDDL